MRYHQFDHLEPNEGDFYRKITETVAKHLDVEGDVAAVFGERLISHGFLNRYQVFDLSKDIAALERVSKALLEISRAMSDVSISPLATERLNQSLLFGGFFDNLMKQNTAYDTDEFRNYLENTGLKDVDALTRIDAEVTRIRAGVNQTIDHIKSSPLAKKSASKINADAIGVVGACRYIWELAKGKPAPKSLNPASPFAYFLSDVLEAGGIEAQPISAFNAWAREHTKIHTSDLKSRPKCG